jgi:hypothetical protein
VNSRSFGSIYSTFTSASSTSNINNSAEPLLNVTQEDQLQKRLWNEDATLCEREDIAQWLGKK